MKTYNIKQTRTYVTRVTIEAESIDEAYDKHAELVNNGTMGELELEQMEIADDDVEITDPTKKYRFARVCSVTGCGMNEGWVVCDGVIYFSNEEDAIKWCTDNGYASIDEAYEDDAIYYTAWEDECDYFYESEHEDGRDAVEVEGGDQ